MKKQEFSKALLIQESFLIWIITFAYIILAFVCVLKGFSGSLPWLSVIPGLAWGAYGVSQACYYSKAKAENTAQGIKFETVMANLKQENNPVEEFLNQEQSIDIDYGI